MPDSIANKNISFNNLPNPFTTQTRFEYSLSDKSNIHLTIQNLLGQTVASPINNEIKEQGEHYLSFDASALPAGLYICTFSATDEKGEIFRETKKLVKLK